MDSQPDDIVIAILGGTGVGKSSFIASVTGREDVQVGHGLESETSEVQPYRFSHGSVNYVLVDTPGFDDSRMSNEELTSKILWWLESAYRSGIRMNGIIYIHDIRRPRIQGSAFRTMRLFSSLCGGTRLDNVILATSFWDLVAEADGVQREHELKTSRDFWANMLAKGAQVVRLDGSRCGRLAILERIVAQKDLRPEIVASDVLSSSDEIREFEQTINREKEAEKDRLQKTLERGQTIHKQNMEQLQMHRAQSQRQAEETQRRAEKEHKRHVREDRKQMKQERREVEHSLLRMEGKHPWYLKLHALMAFWLLLAAALVGNVIMLSYRDAPASINFALFSIAWSWITVAVGVWSYRIHPLPMIVVLFWDALATLFVFSSAADMATRLGVHSCANENYLRQNELIVGSGDSNKRCRQLQASDAFLWFVFGCLIFITALDIKRALKAHTLGSELSRIRGWAGSDV